MPYKLSLLDIALREELAKAIKNGKVNRKLNSQVSNLVQDDDNHEFEKREKNKKNGNKRYITVDGIKNINKKVEVDAELGEGFEDISVGAFLDKRK